VEASAVNICNPNVETARSGSAIQMLPRDITTPTIATATAVSTIAGGHRKSAISWSPLDQNFEGPNVDIEETAPVRGYLLRPPNRTPDGGGSFPAGCSLRSTPPSAGESKLPARESFPEPWLIGQRAVIGGEALNATFGPPTCPPTNSATSNDAASKLLPIIAKKPMLDLWCAISRSCMTTLDV
jgi:hypothetical protein